MSRSQNVRRHSSINVTDTSKSNKESINVDFAASKEQDSPTMGELRKVFEKLTIDDEPSRRKRRSLARTNVVNENTAEKNSKEKKISKTRDDKDTKKTGNEKKSRASSKADNNAQEKRKTINQAQDPGSRISVKVTKKKSPHLSSGEKNQRQADVPSTSADSCSGVKTDGKSSKKKSIIGINSNGDSLTKEVCKGPSRVHHQIPAMAVKPVPRSLTGEKNISRRTRTKTTGDNPQTMTTEKKPPRKDVRNKTNELGLMKGKTGREVNKSYVLSPSDNTVDNKMPQSKMSTIQIGNKKVPPKPEGLVNPKMDSPVMMLAKREKQSPQSPIASVSVKLECRGTPPATTARTLNPVDIKKYEKSSINERGISLGNTGINQGLVGIGNRRSASGKPDVVKDNLEKTDGCSSDDLQLHQQPSRKALGAEPRANDVRASQLEGSGEKDHRGRREEKKVGKAFETLAAHFVSTAKKMGYLDDVSEDSSTDDTEDSEHSTDCSCSSCSNYSSHSDDSEHSTDCSCSSCTGTSSDVMTEYTISRSSSTSYSDSSASDRSTSSSMSD
ncbi:uncharacterized protein LOC135164279 [Diachasmimorpha longicaudata]|uniref:uncharacterized protein LOC135164279 n=1 Tax=Diachasmimorpha longicaudata TaxID=58733 RepID=UPI0030B8E630